MIGAWKKIIRWRWDFLKIPLLVSKPKLVHPISVRMPKNWHPNFRGQEFWGHALDWNSSMPSSISQENMSTILGNAQKNRMRKWQKKTHAVISVVFVWISQFKILQINEGLRFSLKIPRKKCLRIQETRPKRIQETRVQHFKMYPLF